MQRQKYLWYVGALGAFIILGVPHLTHANTALTKEVTISSGNLHTVTSRPFTLSYNNRTWSVPAATLKTWFKTRSDSGQTVLQLRPNAIYDYLNTYVSPRINDLGEMSRFVRKNGTIELAGT